MKYFLNMLKFIFKESIIKKSYSVTVSWNLKLYFTENHNYTINFENQRIFTYKKNSFSNITILCVWVSNSQAFTSLFDVSHRIIKRKKRKNMKFLAFAKFYVSVLSLYQIWARSPHSSERVAAFIPFRSFMEIQFTTMAKFTTTFFFLFHLFFLSLYSLRSFYFERGRTSPCERDTALDE